jgi:hypothetical protein
MFGPKLWAVIEVAEQVDERPRGFDGLIKIVFTGSTIWSRMESQTNRSSSFFECPTRRPSGQWPAGCPARGFTTFGVAVFGHLIWPMIKCLSHCAHNLNAYALHLLRCGRTLRVTVVIE